MASEDRPTVTVISDGVVVGAGVLTDRRDFVALIGELTRSVDEAFPVVEALNWRADAARARTSGVTQKTRGESE